MLYSRAKVQILTPEELRAKILVTESCVVSAVAYKAGLSASPLVYSPLHSLQASPPDFYPAHRPQCAATAATGTATAATGTATGASDDVCNASGTQLLA